MSGPFKCIAPACGPDCCGCNHAVSVEAARVEIEVDPIPTRWQTVRDIARGLLPYQGDLHDLQDGAHFLWQAMRCWGHLALRVVMIALAPLTMILLFPMVRYAQRRKHEYDLGEADRRAALIAQLTRSQNKI